MKFFENKKIKNCEDSLFTKGKKTSKKNYFQKEPYDNFRHV